MRFLIDECLSIDLIPIAGHDAQHVARIGKAGWKDWNVVRTAADGDFVLVTNNASDFRKLYATTPVLEVGIDGEDVTLDLYDLPLHPSA